MFKPNLKPDRYYRHAFILRAFILARVIRSLQLCRTGTQGLVIYPCAKSDVAAGTINSAGVSWRHNTICGQKELKLRRLDESRHKLYNCSNVSSNDTKHDKTGNRKNLEEYVHNRIVTRYVFAPYDYSSHVTPSDPWNFK